MTPVAVPLLVVGGGIGGLSAALALARAGHRVRLVEQAPEFTEVGAGLQLAPNATRALDRLGVLEAVLRRAVRPSVLVMLDAVDGDELAVLDVGDAFVDRYRAPYVVLHRHDLLSVLLDACRAEEDVELENNRHVLSCRIAPGHVAVTCSDGTIYHAGAVIGADGLRSRMRAMVSDDEPLETGFVAYRGPVPIGLVKGAVRTDAVVVWVGPGLHLVQYPLRHGQLLNQVAVFRSDRYAPHAGDWGGPEELRARFSRMCPAVARSVELLDQTMRWPMHDRMPIGNWTSGPVTLLGDAAHPMLQYLAQGACQALEDAVELGEQFPAGRDPEEAFRAYQAVRVPRTARVQRSARAWGELWHLDGVARDVRNRYLRARRADDFVDIDWLYGTDVLTAVTASGG